MLPWLFGVLLALNAALFYWGYQREQSREPTAPELPRLEYEIRLLSELEDAGDVFSTAAISDRELAEQGDELREAPDESGEVGSSEPQLVEPDAPPVPSEDPEANEPIESQVDTGQAPDAARTEGDSGESSEDGDGQATVAGDTNRVGVDADVPDSIPSHPEPMESESNGAEMLESEPGDAAPNDAGIDGPEPLIRDAAEAKDSEADDLGGDAPSAEEPDSTPSSESPRDIDILPTEPAPPPSGSEQGPATTG